MSLDASTADLGYVTVTRDFDAPREVVFGAFMDPGQLARFWGPTGTHVPPGSVVIEPVAGGRFEATIVADDGSGEYTFRSTFVEITAPEMFSFREGGASVLSTSTFTDLGNGRTRVVIEQSEVPPAYRSVEGLAGFATTLELLADHLGSVATGSGDRGLTQVVVASAAGIRITRDFSAAREQVWAAWTTPTSFAQWFGTRAVTVPADRLSWDVREGQDWAAVMRAPRWGGDQLARPVHARRRAATARVHDDRRTGGRPSPPSPSSCRRSPVAPAWSWCKVAASCQPRATGRRATVGAASST